ncbi:MAG: BlaI/MecI/CopY family transcriptional regulator [Planctomycetes bacterium]|nr:BlaI/MecI/CopY family transcriptional regulator [Planctomycetota bacterium]
MVRPRLGDLQLAILEVLWERGESTVADVHAALLVDRGLATTTIATMLRKMEEKHLVAQRRDGRVLVYRARMERDAVHRSLVGDLVERLFAGDPKALVHHLIDEGDLDVAAIDELKRRIARRRKEVGDVR